MLRFERGVAKLYGYPEGGALIHISVRSHLALYRSNYANGLRSGTRVMLACRIQKAPNEFLLSPKWCPLEG